MPVYRFKCDLGHTFRKLMTVEQFKESGGHVTCYDAFCSAIGHYTPITSVGNQTLELLDNGISARPVERLSEAERIFREREEAHDQKYKVDNTDPDDT